MVPAELCYIVLNMPPSAEYARQTDGSSVPSDSDPDEDLDLEELDPTTASLHKPSRISRDDTALRRGYGPGIALRSLRSGIESRPWSRRSASGPHAGSDEDLSGLLDGQDGEGVHSSLRASRTFADDDDDAPLLHDPRRNSSRSFKDDGPSTTNGSPLRFLGLKSSNLLKKTTANSFSSRTRNPEPKPPRDVLVGQQQRAKYPPNIVSNAKYTPWSFLPRTLYNEFSFFFNIYFLLVALSQIIPVLRIGYISSYIAPLAFVVSLSLAKEAVDDIGRRRRDAEANSEEYSVVYFDKNTPLHSEAETALEITKRSRDLKVGDVLKLRKNERLPADVVVLKSVPGETANTTRKSTSQQTNDEPYTDLVDSSRGSPADQGRTQANSSVAPEEAIDLAPSDTFIRTDQLDGETDWKLRLPPMLSQALPLREFTRLKITASPPDKKVNDFVGTIELKPSTGFYDLQDESENQNADAGRSHTTSLTIDNTAWANTVIASNTTTYAAIIYSGSQTRAAMSTSPSRSKVGLLEYEINNLTKILCVLTFALSVILVALEGFQPTNDKEWYVAIMIYLILFSTIIPMSLRVNLDMAKTVYGRFIERDKDIPETVVRTSTIPEDLGRIEYLLSDKTGTLTQNDMELKKIHVGTVSYANEAIVRPASICWQCLGEPLDNL